MAEAGTGGDREMTDTAELRKLAEAAAKDFTPDLPDDLRVPLHSLQADTAYLLGRVNIDGVTTIPHVQGSILNRLSQIETACYGLNADLTAKDAEIAALKEKVKRQAEALRSIRAFSNPSPYRMPDETHANLRAVNELARAAQEAGHE